MTRQIYGYISAIYTLTDKMLVNPNNQRESDEMVSMDDIELITMAPDARSPNRFKIRVKEGREHIEPWKSWLNPTTIKPIRYEGMMRSPVPNTTGPDVSLRDLLQDQDLQVENPPHSV